MIDTGDGQLGKTGGHERAVVTGSSRTDHPGSGGGRPVSQERDDLMGLRIQPLQVIGQNQHRPPRTRQPHQLLRRLGDQEQIRAGAVKQPQCRAQRLALDLG